MFSYLVICRILPLTRKLVPSSSAQNLDNVSVLEPLKRRANLSPTFFLSCNFSVETCCRCAFQFAVSPLPGPGPSSIIVGPSNVGCLSCSVCYFRDNNWNVLHLRPTNFLYECLFKIEPIPLDKLRHTVPEQCSLLNIVSQLSYSKEWWDISHTKLIHSLETKQVEQLMQLLLIILIHPELSELIERNIKML